MVFALVAVGGGTAHAELRVRALFEAHFDGVWRALRRLRLTEAAADDVAQEVFVTAARKLDAIELGRERSFLVGTAIRLAANARRKREHRDAKNAVDVDDLPVASEAPLPDVQVESRRRLALPDRALASLPEELRTAIVLAELEGMSHPEIAALLELPLGTVASRIRRARQELAVSVAAMTEDPARRTS